MPDNKLTALGEALAAHRKRPCLFFVSHFMGRLDAHRLRGELKKHKGDEIDVVVHSGGGDPDSAYVMARDLGRRFERIGIFVPLRAKSAATLMSLVGDEFVLGEHGEMGPIDVQAEEPREGEFVQHRSCLERFKALEQIQRHAIETYDYGVRIGLAQEMSLMDACRISVDLTGKLMEPLYSQIDPEKVGQSARYLELAEKYALRILKRYSQLDENAIAELVFKLGSRYPSHGFVIDGEELAELGLPARPATAEESKILEQMEYPLWELVSTEGHWTSLVEPPSGNSTKKKAATRKVAPSKTKGKTK